MQRHRTRIQVLSPRVAVAGTCLLVLASAAALYARSASADKADDRFTIKPEAIEFGRRALFTSHTETFWVKNKGNGAVDVANVDLQGSNEGVFAVKNGCGRKLAVGEECRIDVTFAPTSDGNKSAELRIVAGDNSVRTRQLSGVGVKAEYSVTPAQITFGRVPLKGESKTQTVTIRNTGQVALPITATSLAGPNEHQFSQSNDCPQELAIGQTCTSTVKFNPSDQGHKTANLTVWAKGGAPEKKVELSGTGGG